MHQWEPKANEIFVEAMEIESGEDRNQPVHRRVAVKVIKPGMDTRQVIARFEAERQALALMDHPNIAKVLDAGSTESGRPFFVMELVKGTTITKFCDQQHLGTRDRLQLFVEVCHAVQHAHQKGIIHRDLKPSNVLVAMYDDCLVTKVIDFGVAKATGEQLTEKTMFTRFGQVLGTLEYMSPEQAQFNQMDIDTRSDIYSLGAILYELLAGQPPFDQQRMNSQALDETLRMIREEEPTKPSTKLSSAARLAEIASNRNTTPEKLGSQLRGDLDWIVLKAIEKNRSRRYETANGMAMDVYRYLSDEPVLATPPSATYRFHKFARRNKVALVISSMAAVFLLLGATGLAVSNYLVTKQKTATEEALGQARTEAAIATAVNEFINTDLLGKADPHDEPNRELTVSQVLDRALQSIEGRFAGQPLVDAKIRSTIAEALQNLGRYEEAERQLIAGHQICIDQFGPHDRETLAVEAAMLWNAHGQGVYKVDEQEKLLTQSRKLFADDDPLTLRMATNLADFKRHLGQSRESVELLQDVLDVQKRSLGPKDADTLSTMNLLSMALLANRRLVDAEKLAREVLEIRIRKPGPEHPLTLDSMHVLANILREQDRYNEAEKHYRKVLEIRETLLGPKSRRTLLTRSELAKTFCLQGRYDKAAKLTNEVDQDLELVLGANNPQTLTHKINFGVALYDSGRFAKAEELFRDTAAYSERVLGPEDPETLNCLVNLAASIAEQHRYAEAEELLHDLVEIQKRVLGVDHEQTLHSLGNLIAIIIHQGRYAEGESLTREAITSSKNKYNPEHAMVLLHADHLARLKELQGQYAEAKELYNDLWEIKRRVLGPKNPDTQLTATRLVGLRHGVPQQWTEAAEAFGSLDSDFSQNLYNQALSLLGAEDIDGYRRVLVDMQTRLADAKDPRSQYFLAWTWALQPIPADQVITVQQTAQSLVKQSPLEKHRIAEAATQLRCGELPDAIEKLHQLSHEWEAGELESKTFSPAVIWYFLAMAYLQQDNVEQSQTWLDRANKQSERELTDTESPATWDVRLINQLLQIEVEQMMAADD